MKTIKRFSQRYGTNRTFVITKCSECSKTIEVLKSEVKRGGGKTCSRDCYYIRLKRVRPRDKNSWAWKGDKVGKEALHNWVQKHRGKPNKCEHCKTTEAKKYEWANRSQEYKRELNDWLRLCTRCHAKYDYPIRSKKWVKAVRKLGWNVTKVSESNEERLLSKNNIRWSY